MVPLLESLRVSISVHKLPMECFYRFVGISRQGYLKKRLGYYEQLKMVEEIGDLIKDYRTSKDGNAGLRSLYYNLDIKIKYDIGVNKFEQLMSRSGYGLVQKRVKVITTQACSNSRKYENLTKGLIINGINQLIVGDITYLLIGEFTYYLFLYTDVYSGRIVGWHLDDRMRATEGLKGLSMVIRLRGKVNLKDCIHHTDGGRQYFANLFLDRLHSVHFRISVAKNCLENGFAEQRNGLLKKHFLPLVNDFSLDGLRKHFEQFINFYNQERKQENLGWQNPVEFEESVKGLKEKPRMRLYDRDKNLVSERFGF
jgi:transposase InsO family protein